MIPFDIPKLDGDFGDFTAKIGEFKKEYDFQMLDLINSTVKEADIDNLSGLTDGRVTFRVNDVDFECLFFRGGGKGERAKAVCHFGRWHWS